MMAHNYLAGYCMNCDVKVGPNVVEGCVDQVPCNSWIARYNWVIIYYGILSIHRKDIIARHLHLLLSKEYVGRA